MTDGFVVAGVDGEKDVNFNHRQGRVEYRVDEYTSDYDEGTGFNEDHSFLFVRLCQDGSPEKHGILVWRDEVDDGDDDMSEDARRRYLYQQAVERAATSDRWRDSLEDAIAEVKAQVAEVIAQDAVYEKHSAPDDHWIWRSISSGVEMKLNLADLYRETHMVTDTEMTERVVRQQYRESIFQVGDPDPWDKTIQKEA